MPFKKATRSGTKALIGLYGGSGSGKTYSALLVARGLVGPTGNIFMIDTESRRGEMYADEIPGGYEVDQLEVPFSSLRYQEKINEANQMAGETPTCLIIDSFSHEWEGVGGVVSAAEAIAEGKAKQYNKPWNGTVQFGDWKRPKADHKHMMLQMLGCRMHIICCLRAQYKSRQIEKKDYQKFGITANTKSVVIRDEFQTPIQDANFIYEMTASIELRKERPGVPIYEKMPEMLRTMFPTDKPMSIQTGEQLAKWTEGGAPDDDIMATAIDESLTEADKGIQAYQTWFRKQPRDVKNFLISSGEHAKRKTTAEAADYNKTSHGAAQADTGAYGGDDFPGDY